MKACSPIPAAAALTANPSIGNTTPVTQFVTAYQDRRTAYAAGIHSPTLAAMHTGRAPLWDRQAIIFGGLP